MREVGGGALFSDRSAARSATDTARPRWLLGGKPDPSRAWDLNPHDQGCDNDFSIQTKPVAVLLDFVLERPYGSLPMGSQKVDWLWCGGHGLQDQTVVLTRVSSPA